MPRKPRVLTSFGKREPLAVGDTVQMERDTFTVVQCKPQEKPDTSGNVAYLVFRKTNTGTKRYHGAQKASGEVWVVV